MASKISTLVFCLMFLLPTSINGTVDHGINAIYQFGDSLSDTGNLVRQNPIGGYYFARPPYGIDFKGHHPTGRCSDGLLIIDHITNFFNLPFLDPYLKKDGNFIHGVNFAVAGSTALDVTSLVAKFKSSLLPTTNSSLSVQLGWFRSHLSSICSNPLECKDKLHNALFFMGEIGGNDFNYALMERNSMDDIKKMVPEVVQVIKNAVEEIIYLGATRVVVPGNFPIGCTPAYLTYFGAQDPSLYDEFKCLKSLNELAAFQNTQLQQAIRELQLKHPHVSIFYGDYFNALRQILLVAPSLGFDKDATTKACCGSGNNAYNFNIYGMCGSIESRVCPNPHDHVNWDGVHLTSHAYFHIAKNLLKKIVPAISTRGT